MKGCLYEIKDIPIEIPIFFENVDRHFDLNKIDPQC